MVDLTNGSIAKGIISFAIPVFLGQLLQQLYNMADAWVVGNFADNDAFAAVSSSGSLIFFITGFFSGIAIGGNLVYGHDGFAGELGHVIMRRNNGRPCGCGRQGCLEAYTSATGVARTAREYLEIRKDESLLRELDPDEITSKDVFDAAMKGDKLALEIFEFTGNMLGEAFADFVAFSSPEAIILFGGLTKAGDLLMNPIKRSMEKNMLKVYEGKTKLLFSQLKESDAAVLGASALGWEVKE